ncbi:MAG: single-stranded DNA-binding protein, partial [Myxococcota bacterium]
TDKTTGERKERTSWHSVRLDGGRFLGVLPYLSKGKQVYVEGPHNVTSYERKDGTKGIRSEILARDLKLLGGKGDAGSGSPELVMASIAPNLRASAGASDDDDLNEIPF